MLFGSGRCILFCLFRRPCFVFVFVFLDFQSIQTEGGWSGVWVANAKNSPDPCFPSPLWHPLFIMLVDLCFKVNLKKILAFEYSKYSNLFVDVPIHIIWCLKSMSMFFFQSWTDSITYRDLQTLTPPGPMFSTMQRPDPSPSQSPSDPASFFFK